MKEIIYVGHDFYMESGTIMSSMYEANGDRYDTGFLNRDLRNGELIVIRQATTEERAAALADLAKLKARK